VSSTPACHNRHSWTMWELWMEEWFCWKWITASGKAVLQIAPLHLFIEGKAVYVLFCIMMYSSCFKGDSTPTTKAHDCLRACVRACVCVCGGRRMLNCTVHFCPGKLVATLGSLALAKGFFDLWLPMQHLNWTGYMSQSNSSALSIFPNQPVFL
jgi:hypothetical protein